MFINNRVNNIPTPTYNILYNLFTFKLITTLFNPN